MAILAAKQLGGAERIIAMSRHPERQELARFYGACRHRAWEQTQAAASGRAAVEVVERRVEVRVPLEPTRRDWSRLLGELAEQLNDGRVYDRDLPGLTRALEPVLQAYRRRAPLTGAPV